MDAAVRNWAESDSVAASAWISELPEGQTRDTALSSYTRGLAQTDPAVAAAWAEGITEPALRTRALERVAVDWLKLDPPAAKAWLEQSPLSHDSRERVLKPKKG